MNSDRLRVDVGIGSYKRFFHRLRHRSAKTEAHSRKRINSREKEILSQHL